jgi:Sulfotransferase domain
MFPKIKELALIRDLRDVVCSAKSSSGSAFDRVMDATKTAARQLIAIDAERDCSIMFLKYEDFVLDNAPIMAKVFRFLGLAPITSNQDSMNALFTTHATSTTPAASIGRWKLELTSEQTKKCEEFSSFLEHFGYEI